MIDNEQKPWRQLFFNFSALSIIQAANSLIPLVVLPYLYSVLGVENLGKVFLAQAVANLFVQLVDYGFPNTAVRNVSQNRLSSSLPELTGQLFTLRVALLVLGFVSFILIIIFIPSTAIESQNFLFSYLIVAGQALNPYWLLQGIEKTKYQALVSLSGKILFVLLTFLVIKNKNDYSLVNGLQGGTALLAGAIAWGMIWKNHLLAFSTISLRSLYAEMKLGFINFVSGFINFSSASSYLILTSYFAGVSQVGYFGIAEKIFLFGRAAPIIIYQAIYPHVCKIAELSFEELKKFFQSFYLIILPIFIPITVLMFVFASDIIHLLIGKPVPEAVYLLKITVPIPFLATISIPFGQLLLAKHFNQSYMNAIFAGSALTFIASVILISQLQATGAAIAALLGELIMIISLSFQIEKRHRNLSLFAKSLAS